MRKKSILLIVLVAILHGQFLQAQQGTVTAGGDSTGNGGAASYSVGWVAYSTITGSGGTASEGLQQPYEIYVLGTDDFESIRLSVKVYPNPTVSTVNLSLDSQEPENTRFELYDLNGKLLKEQQVTARETPMIYTLSLIAFVNLDGTFTQNYNGKHLLLSYHYKMLLFT